LLFGQKAKNVKTTVNINEIPSAGGEKDLEKAYKTISQLKTRIAELEKSPPRTQKK